MIKDARKADNPEAYSLPAQETGPSWGIGLGFSVTSKIIYDCNYLMRKNNRHQT
jgi:hypothetical protein